MRLEDIHFANFLGLKDSENGAPYNIDYPVNLNQCDILQPEFKENNISEIESLPDENCLDQYEAEWSDIPKIKREKKTFTSNDEQPEAKRARYEYNLAEMVEYMRQQVELAHQMMADELYVCDCEY